MDLPFESIIQFCFSTFWFLPCWSFGNKIVPLRNKFLNNAFSIKLWQPMVIGAHSTSTGIPNLGCDEVNFTQCKPLNSAASRLWKQHGCWGLCGQAALRPGPFRARQLLSSTLLCSPPQRSIVLLRLLYSSKTALVFQLLPGKRSLKSSIESVRSKPD